MRVIVKVKDESVTPKLIRYGTILSKFNFTNAVGMEVERKNIDKIKSLKGIESVKISERVRLIRKGLYELQSKR